MTELKTVQTGERLHGVAGAAGSGAAESCARAGGRVDARAGAGPSALVAAGPHPRAAPGPKRRPAPARFAFLDALRLIAAVQMIQGHSVASVLAPAHRVGRGYAVWMFARGLTSVVFLISAGLAFVLAEARAHSPAARRRRVARALRMIALGYLMHAPLAILFGAPSAPTLRAALAVDVLQCIGVSLLALELLSAAVSDLRLRSALALALGALCFGLAPFAHSLALSPASLPLGNYLSARYGSLFPLVPWAGYVLCGFGLGGLAFRVPSAAGARAARARDPAAVLRAEPTWPARAACFGAGTGRVPGVLAAGSALCGLGGALGMSAFPALPVAASPAYCLLKLGCALGLAALLAWALRGVARLPSLLEALASETLFLYVSHVLILYADQVGLESKLRDAHTPAFGLALALALLVGCGAGALGFRSLRARAQGGTRAAPVG